MQSIMETAQFHQWATIAEVSDALGVPYDTIKQTVAKAHALQQSWVKQEPYPAPGFPLRWLIDTSHATYRYHEARWRKLAEETGTEPSPQMPGGTEKYLGNDEMKGRQSSSSAPDTQQQPTDVTATWPALCDWLADAGLVVFVNAIGFDQSWQLSWQDHCGCGYPDATAAITAALQYQYLFGELLPPSACISSCGVTTGKVPWWKSLLFWNR